MNVLKRKIDISAVTNPFFVFPIAFGIAVSAYLFGWSDIYPGLSSNLILFLSVSSIAFILAGIIYRRKRKAENETQNNLPQRILDVAFISIIFFGITDISIMGYIPILGRSASYKVYGAPVIDVLFNTLSIFFSVVFLYSFLKAGKKSNLFYILTILIFQLLLFRRSTIIWIVVSSTFLTILHLRKVLLWIPLASVLLIPLLSHLFGFYGSIRSHLSREFIENEFKPSMVFRNSGISTNHYMTYLYLTSPLANLQNNISKVADQKRGKAFDKFLFYCVIPPSFTLRLEKVMNIKAPEPRLINKNLIVGTCFMTCFITLSWYGMIIMSFLILVYLVLAIKISGRCGPFSPVTLSLLSTTVSFMVFDNMFYRLDMILVLFIYPLLFQFINRRIYLRQVSQSVKI